MADVATSYNALPTLGQADDLFTDREATQLALATLLARYDYTFGLCLVHAHCTIAQGEIMLAKGNVSQPEMADHAPAYHAERWLSTGQPYEFTVRKTERPPQALINEFQRIVKKAQFQDVLGLYHIDRTEGPKAIIEWTEGRKNFTREITKEDEVGQPIQTAWDFGRGDPVTMSCAIYCDSRTTRSGGTHKGTKSHINV